MKNLYEKYQQSSGVCTDSRNLLPDCLFVCLKGANFDGNKFAAEVLEQGAKYVITENTELRDNPRAVVVDDALKTLQQLANYHRKQLKIPFIGITGTNGKTTTKELVNAVLSSTYKTTCTQGNLNNHIGVILCLWFFSRNFFHFCIHDFRFLYWSSFFRFCFSSFLFLA